MAELFEKIRPLVLKIVTERGRHFLPKLSVSKKAVAF